MQSYVINASVQLNDEDVLTSVEVHYTFYPYIRGCRDSLGGIRGAGPPLEPDEPAHCEVDKVVRVLNKDEIEVDDDTMIALTKLAEEDYAKRCIPEPPEPDYDWSKMP